MKVIIAGYGSVGKAIHSIINGNHFIHIHDPLIYPILPIKEDVDVLHVCFPLKSQMIFENSLIDLIQRYYPKTVIIHSTITIRLLQNMVSVSPNICWIYSPVRCTEKDMAKEIKEIAMLYAYASNNQTFEMDPYFLYPTHKIQFKDAEALVLGKLMEVCWFAMEIAFVDQIKQICDKHFIDFDEAYTKYWRLSRIGTDYTHPSTAMVPRSIFRPDIMGGKCLIPNVKIALLHFIGDPKLWTWIQEMNSYIEKTKKG